MDFIKQLRPVTYTLDITALDADLDRGSASKLKQGEKAREKSADDVAAVSAKEKLVYTGFIGQEVESAAKSIAYDFSGVDAPKNAHGHYGIRYAEFVVPLVKAVQEQQATIDDFRKKVESLEKMNLELMKRLDVLENKK
jgi:trimeric autotransporter adhesin